VGECSSDLDNRPILHLGAAMFRRKRFFYLHIGIHKTATTFLQKDVFPLLEKVEYVQGCKSLRSVFFASPKAWEDQGREAFDDILGRAKNRGDKKSLLVSDENISTPHMFLPVNNRLRGFRKEPVLLREHLKKLGELVRANGFHDLCVFSSFRRQDEWLASWYSQQSNRMKDPSQKDFEEKVDALLDRKRNFYNDGVWLDYSYLRACLVEAVGERNLLFIPYESLKEKRLEYAAQLSGFIGDKKIISAVKPVLKQKRMARSVSKNHWEIRPPSSRLEPFREKSGVESSIALNNDLRAKIMGFFYKSNRNLQREIGGDLASLGYF